jgi:hypothetical protein
LSKVDLKQIEQQIESFRKRLHEQVDTENGRLTESTVLPISKDLDELIVDYLKSTRRK